MQLIQDTYLHSIIWSFIAPCDLLKHEQGFSLPYISPSFLSTQ